MITSHEDRTRADNIHLTQMRKLKWFESDEINKESQGINKKNGKGIEGHATYQMRASFIVRVSRYFISSHG